MTHKTEITFQKQISDTAIAITIQCCGDPKTASTLTIANVGSLDADAVSTQIDFHHDAVKAKHARMLEGLLLLSNIPNRVKQHA